MEYTKYGKADVPNKIFKNVAIQYADIPKTELNITDNEPNNNIIIVKPKLICSTFLLLFDTSKNTVGSPLDKFEVSTLLMSVLEALPYNRHIITKVTIAKTKKDNFRKNKYFLSSSENSGGLTITEQFLV